MADPIAPYHDRDTWLEARQSGIGSSDIAALFGAHPWKDPIDVYYDKVGELVLTDEENNEMRRGRIFEPIAVQEYERRTGRQTRRMPMRRHPEDEWLITDVDRQILSGTGDDEWRVDETGALEIKVPRWNRFAEWRDHGLSDYVIYQGMHHCLVTSYEYCSFGVLHADSLGDLAFDVEARPTILRSIREEADRFWHEHVMPENPPGMDDEGREGPELPDIEGEVRVRDDADWREAALRWREAKHVLERAQEVEEQAKERLRELMDDYGVVQGGGVRARLDRREGSHIDAEALKRDGIDPDDYRNHYRYEHFRPRMINEEGR